MADLVLHNSLTREKQVFKPIDPAHVRLYVCGNTVYDYAHIGNARPVVVFDVLNRLLRFLYPKVTFARNFTDIDDKIIQRAKENNEPINHLTERFIQAWYEDTDALEILRPDIEPRATDHMAEMIAMIETLIDRGHAYVAEAHVLFDTQSFPDYGKLSRHSQDDLLAGARVEVAPYKRNPMDFVLWKPSTDDMPGWDSPWGRGRPGWHIECSAMSQKHLGETFDIHGGGIDLLFPHHENEIAQSQCAHQGAPLANYWMHNDFLMVNSQKMSKSLGNFLTVREALQQYPGEVVRLTLLGTHYRQLLDFSDRSLEQAKSILDRLYEALRKTADTPAAEVKIAKDHPVIVALLDDLNTPLAIKMIQDLAGQLFKASKPEDISQLKGELLKAASFLGLLQQSHESWFQSANDIQIDATYIEGQIAARTAARQAKDFAQADSIRQALLAQGIALEDTPQGTIWRRSN